VFVRLSAFFGTELVWRCLFFGMAIGYFGNIWVLFGVGRDSVVICMGNGVFFGGDFIELLV
jgi:hypothetical protein